MSDLHTLSGAYALDALSEEEAEKFGEHLSVCAACRDEVRELRETAARLGAAEALQPPDFLKQRVTAAADLETQLPPRARHAAGARTRRRRLVAGGLAAAAVVAAVVAGVTVSQVQRSDQPAPVAAVFDAADAHSETLPTSNGGTLEVATSARLGVMAVDTEALPRLPGARVYQLWEIADGRPRPAGLLAGPAAGKAWELPAPGTRVAITIEPPGGSRHPTSDPIVVVDPYRLVRG